MYEGLLVDSGPPWEKNLVQIHRKVVMCEEETLEMCFGDRKLSLRVFRIHIIIKFSIHTNQTRQQSTVLPT